MSDKPHPCCGRKLDGHTAADGSDEQPRQGDVSVCAYCGSWLTYDHGPRLRLMTQEEIDALDEETTSELWRATTLAERARAEGDEK